MNFSHDKNLDALRAEADKVAAQIGRLSFARASVFVLFVFSLASAFQNTNTGNASGIAEHIRELAVITGNVPELDAFAERLYFPHGYQAPTRAASTLPADSADIARRDSVNAARSDSASARQQVLATQLNEVVDRAFKLSLHAPLLGTELTFDMRVWGPILPLCFIVWEVYLHILRYKLCALRRIAALVARTSPLKATVLDGLQFRLDAGGSNSWTKHPDQLEMSISLIVGLSLFIFLCKQGYGFWKGTDPEITIQLIEAYGFVLAYALAYGAYVVRRLEAEAMAIEGMTPAFGWWHRLLERADGWLASRARRLPEIPLGSGSLLVLGSLWLAVGAPFGCDPVNGWEYLHDPGGWLVGPVTGAGVLADWHDGVIATLYGMSLLIAMFTVGLLLASIARRARATGSVGMLCAAVSTTTLALFFLTEMTFGQVLDLTPWGLFGIALWLVPIWIWWRHLRSHPTSDRMPRLRRALVLWFFPQVLVAAFVAVGTMFEHAPLPGVPVFVCGLGGMSLGYWYVLAREAEKFEV